MYIDTFLTEKENLGQEESNIVVIDNGNLKTKTSIFSEEPNLVFRNLKSAKDAIFESETEIFGAKDSPGMPYKVNEMFIDEQGYFMGEHKATSGFVTKHISKLAGMNAENWKFCENDERYHETRNFLNERLSKSNNEKEFALVCRNYIVDGEADYHAVGLVSKNFHVVQESRILQDVLESLTGTGYRFNDARFSEDVFEFNIVSENPLTGLKDYERMEVGDQFGCLKFRTGNTGHAALKIISQFLQLECTNLGTMVHGIRGTTYKHNNQSIRSIGDKIPDMIYNVSQNLEDQAAVFDRVKDMTLDSETFDNVKTSLVRNVLGKKRTNTFLTAFNIDEGIPATKFYYDLTYYGRRLPSMETRDKCSAFAGSYLQTIAERN